MSPVAQKWLILASIPLVIACAFAPELVHGLDSGLQTVALQDLENRSWFATRNVIVTQARALVDASVELSSRDSLFSARSSSTASLLIPIVPTSWNENMPVAVVMQTDNVDVQQQVLLQQSTAFRATVRDVLWEGLSASDRQYLSETMGIQLSDKIKLVHYMVNPRYDLVVFVVWVATGFVGMLLIGLGVRLRMSRLIKHSL